MRSLLIQVNFDPIQEIGLKVGEGALSRVGAPSHGYGICFGTCMVSVQRSTLGIQL